ncbi:hypothetical protein WA026_013509 [Henosepilachna vigintioctopunctata]|uniref:C2H2-type domain-containing protein n=1 Tax=Henosepilachna vigintioctopunctata TaxID=420089 RepID=A0AAW1VCH9_9CUCU
MDKEVKNEYELMLTERMLNKLDNDDNENIIHQIVDENGKLSPEKDFITTWKLNCIKTETSGELDNENDSKELVFLDLEEEYKFNGIKIENITFDSAFIGSENNWMWNNESGYTINKIEVTEENNQKCDVSAAISTIHSEQKNYKCHSCDYSSSWKEYLQSHIKSVHLKKPRSHKCHLCDYSSSWKGDLQSHINSVHLKIKNHKCCKCDYSSSQKTAVRKHINSVHLKLRDHKCHLCDYTSSRNGDLQKHIKSVHLKLKNHKCHVCDYRSSRNGDLQSHIKSIHLKQKTHK